MRACLPLLLTTCLLVPWSPDPAHGLEFYVDATLGSDARQPLDAQSEATPWRTIQRALRFVGEGHVVHVKPGRYEEALQSVFPQVSLVGDGARGEVVVAPAGDSPGLVVTHQGFTVEGLVFEGGTHGIRASGADGLAVRDTVTVGSAANGFSILDSHRILIENSAAISAAGRGILLKRSNSAYLRNNLVYDNRDGGIAIEGGSGSASTSHLIAFNTIAYNGRGGALGLSSAKAEIRDNIIVASGGTALRIDRPGSHVHHVLLSGVGSPIDPPDYVLGAGMRSGDPRFVAPAGADGILGGIGTWLDDDFSLGDPAAGQSSPRSPGIDAGSADVGPSDISGTTRSDRLPDDGVADLGFHRDALSSRGIPDRAPPPPGGPGPGRGAEHHVDCAAGDDARTKLEARNPATPWRTLRRAMQDLVYGEVAVVAPGVCAEFVETRSAGIAIRAREPGATVIEAPPGTIGFNVQHDDVTVDGFVVHSSLQGVLAASSKAGVLLSNLVLRNLVIEPPAGEAITTNGIQVRDAARVTVENTVVTGAEQQGILLKRVGRAYVRNNLVHGNPNDWGISIDGDSPNRFAPQSGNVVAFNTVTQNGQGLRLRNASGEVRDNVVAQNDGTGLRYTEPDAAWMVHHNDAAGNSPDYDLPSGIRPHTSNLSVAPRFVDAAARNFALRQLVAEGVASPLLDAGSGPVAALDIDGSTASDGRPDDGVADPGYHAGARASAQAPGGRGPQATPAPPPTPTPTPSPTPVPLPGSRRTFYIDPSSGDDGRPVDAAQTQAGAWRSLARAMNAAEPGDVIALRPGTYREQADFKRNAVTLRGDGPLGSVVLAPPGRKAGVYVDGRSQIRIYNLAIEGAAQGVVARKARDLDVQGVAVVGSASNGISVTDSDLVWIQNSIVASSGAMGIKTKQTTGVYVRNNLVYGNADWAISIDATTKARTPPTTGNVVAFNTVHANQNGVRLLNASGEVRDNNLTAQANLGVYLRSPNVLVHHNLFSGNGRDRDQKNDFRESIFVWENASQSPRYVAPAGRDRILGGTGWRDDDFRVMQIVAGDAQQSPAVDSGSGAASALDIDGSTARNGLPDDGTADIGFHYGAGPGLAPPVFPPVGHRVAATYHVNSATGDDARTRATAKRAEAPWRTIARALRDASSGDTILVQPGLYTETAQIDVPGVAVLSEVPGGATIEPEKGNGITIEAPGVTVDGFVVTGGETGIAVLEPADDATIRNCAVIASRGDGIRAVDADRLTVEHSISTGGRGSGIRVKRGDAATIRNNLIYANDEWGVSLDASGAAHPVSRGHLVAHNTIAFNRAGNLTFLSATGEARDNLITNSAGRGLRLDQPDVLLRHNGYFANTSSLQPATYLFTCTLCTENRPLDPKFVDPDGSDGVLGGFGWADDDFRLSNVASGQKADSQAIDRGSETAGPPHLGGTTRTDGVPDTGPVDLGFHYGATPRALTAPVAP